MAALGVEGVSLEEMRTSLVPETGDGEICVLLVSRMVGGCVESHRGFSGLFLFFFILFHV